MKKFAAIFVLIAIVAMVVPVAAQTPEPAKDVYIVVMAADPVIAYEGGVEGLQPTKPGRGGKINPNSAHVKKYEKFLEKEQNKELLLTEITELMERKRDELLSRIRESG